MILSMLSRRVANTMEEVENPKYVIIRLRVGYKFFEQ